MTNGMCDHLKPVMKCPICSYDFKQEHEGYDVRDKVFSNCNVCGIPIRTFEEEQMGMCESCASE